MKLELCGMEKTYDQIPEKEKSETGLKGNLDVRLEIDPETQNWIKDEDCIPYKKLKDIK